MYSRQPPSYRLTGTRAMARFKCIADQCEDTCCGGGLVIALAREDVSRMEEALGGSPEDKAALEGALIRREEPPHAAFLSDGSGSCGLLTPNKLCGVIARGHPPSALPDVCHLFPRRFALVPGEGVQMVASMACPEAARLALWSEDGLELEDLPPSTTEIFPVADPAAPVEPYVQAFGQVQAWGRRLLLDRRVPLPARLMAIAALGRQVDGDFHRGAPASPAPLQEALRELESPGALERISQEERPSASIPVLAAVRFWLMTALPRAMPRAAPLLSACLERWNAAAGGAPGAEPSLEALARAHLDARAALGDAAADHARVLERYCAANWLEEPYTACATLGERAFRLAVRAAIVRTLFLFHPAAADPETRPGAAVEAVQIYSRHIERDGTVHRAMDVVLPLGQLGTDGYGRTALFAGLC